MDQLTGITQLAPAALLGLFLTGLAFCWAKTPLDNKWIPLLLPLLGAVIYPFIGELGKLSFVVKSTVVYQAIVGACIGFSCVGVNQIKRKLIDKPDTAPPSDGQETTPVKPGGI